MSYSNEEILDALDGSSIGGGAEYTESDGKLHPSDADIEVASAEGLVDALAGPSDVIAIENDATLDLTGEEMLDLGSKTLVSYRGWDGQDGAILYTNSRGYYGARPYTLFHSNDSPRLTGLRIGGPRFSEEFTRWDYDDNLARALMLRGPGGEVDNCDIGGWTWTAIHVKGEGEDTVTDAEIHHNRIHKSYQIGYGYGVDIWRGFGDIHHNYFEETRHAIVGYGWWNSGYTVENNVFGPRQYSHAIDMHSLEENNANDRVGDDQDDPNYDLRAGGDMVIQNNTFTMDESVTGGGINAIAIRGLPWVGVSIENNRFAHPEQPTANSGNTQQGDAWRQVNLELSGYEEIPQGEAGFTPNWSYENNQFDAADTPREQGVGAPVDLTEPESESGVLTIDGQGSTVYYTFTVDGDVEKSTEYGGTVNDYDEIITYDDLDSVVTGRTTAEPDSFAFDSEITSFGISSPATVSLDGVEIDPEQFDETVITVTGRGTTTLYEFEYTGSVEKSTAHDGTINEFDQIESDSVSGRTTNEPDSFAFDGAITAFTADSPVDVLLNGQSTGIWM